ncbi:DUF1279 superfamily [Paramarasmius palmivorus]|uniref:DUF1279 superfamily n=1 Tax=Paramarasmius palmivorus TaxID=297713 RepID=A0AAW0C8Z0_9AGAR
MLRPILRSLIPRVTAPILPVTRIRQPLTSVPRSSNSRLFSHFPARLSTSSPPPKDSSSGQSFSQRLKYLIKSYGWYALGVYLVVGAVDFAAAFAAINLIGAEQVSSMAASVKSTVSGILHSKPAEPGRDEIDPVTAPHAQGGREGLFAMIVLAWTIHKTIFLPVRVGVTAAFTPRLVNWLRTRGWVGGEGTRRAAEEMRERLRNARNRSSH